MPFVGEVSKVTGQSPRLALTHACMFFISITLVFVSKKCFWSVTPITQSGLSGRLHDSTTYTFLGVKVRFIVTFTGSRTFKHRMYVPYIMNYENLLLPV